MTKFRKKPIAIEAEQFFPDQKPWPEGVKRGRPKPWGKLSKRTTGYWILTLESWVQVSSGDWIVTGIQGERYPVKPDIFEESYEALDQDRIFSRRIWRWRWNKLRYKLNPDPEYEAHIEKERAEAQALIDSLPDDPCCSWWCDECQHCARHPKVEIEHIESCAIGQKPDWEECPSGESMHSEKSDQHWWSGWPGAFCLECGAEDLMELCIGRVCECECHVEFWEGYNEAMKGAQEA